jgi:hypothetical protein
VFTAAKFVRHVARWGLVCLGGSSAAAALAAQATPRDSALAPLILTLPVSVRIAGLGGAGVAVSGDAGSVFFNPSGLATIHNIAVEGAVQRYPDGSVEGMGAGGFRLLQFDLGGGFHYLRFSDTSSVRDNLVWVGSGVYRFGLLALGASLKYVSLEDSAGKTRRAGTLDTGLGIHIVDILTVGFSIQNISDWRVSGGPLTLPLSKHLGFSFNFTDPLETIRLLGTMDVAWTHGQDRRTVLGLETGAVFGRVGVVGRIGYGAPPAGAGQREFSLGCGLVVDRLGLDYAWQRRTKLGDQVHRLGVRFTL